MYNSVNEHKEVSVIGGELKKRIHISTNIDKEIFNKLKQYSEDTMIPMTKIIDRALKEYLERKKE